MAQVSPRRHGAFAGLALCAAACATTGQKPPVRDLRAALEGAPPVLWARPPAAPFRASHSTGPLALIASANGELQLRCAGCALLKVQISTASVGAPSISVDRGFMTRLSWVGPREERNLEIFRGSPIASLFRRVWAGAAPGELHVSTPAGFTRLGYFERDLYQPGPLRPVTIAPEATTKPFLVLQGDDGDGGVILFFPHRPELRAWSAEEYRVLGPAEIVITPEDGAVKLSWSLPPASPSLRTSFDAPVYFLPFTGSLESALAELQISDAPLLEPKPALRCCAEGYFVPRPPMMATEPFLDDLTPLRLLRYAPQEMAAFMPANLFAYGSKDGLTWASTTPLMKWISVDPLAERALLRDQAFRVLAFFLAAGAEKGAPPLLVLQPVWAALMPDPSLARTVVFCQFWERRLPEMRRLVRSPFVRPEEARQIMADLDRARRVFAPDGPYSWTTPTPNGGYWFDYFDVNFEGELRYIVNTHATSVANAGELALLARDLGDQARFEYWREMFHRGILGLNWAVDQPWMWGESGDADELNYERGKHGGLNYVGFMQFEWVPHIARIAAEIAPQDLGPLVALMTRLAKAKFFETIPPWAARAAETLSEWRQGR